MSQIVTVQNRDGVALITVDSPPVNALSQGVRQGLLDAVAQVRGDAAVRAAVLACAGRTFIAGADIGEFSNAQDAVTPDLNEVIAAIEAAGKPVVAAIHGTALGGGLELALGCHYRCATPTARLGLPEVNLGLLPGAGGTQRLPRLVGIEAGLDAILSGRMINAPEARKMGVLDELLDGDLVTGALAYAGQLATAGAPLKRVRDLSIDPSSVGNGYFDEYRQGIARKTRGYFAPEKIVQCVEAAVSRPFDEGLALERQLFWECLGSTQSAALRHLFFAEREAGRLAGLPRDTRAREVKKVAVIGAGTMGGGIAMNFANAGIPAVLVEVGQETLDRGLAIVRKNYEATMKKGRLTQEKFERVTGLITGTLDYADIADADLVIEAVFENLDLKKQIFTRLDAVCKPGAILATNTSTLDVDEIAEVTGRPEDVVGLHFFSPANVMRLLEVVRGAKTAPDVLVTAMQMAKQIRKVGVVSGVCYGFIGNRMMEGYIREAEMMLLEGAAPERVDRVLTEFGMAMGPLAVLDLAGVDVRCKVVEEAQAKGILPNDGRYNAVVKKLVEMGRYGLKTGAGIYRYETGSRTPRPDPEVAEMIAAEAERLGVERREIGDQEILERCVYPLINEGARILDEGIAYRSGDVDLVWVNGYGFPPHRGGPMHYADAVGLDTVHERLCAYRDQFPKADWEPAALLESLAKAGKGFSNR